MKIISKYKDYYDYLSGIYGEDPKLILDRRNSNLLHLYNNSKIELYIAGYIIEGLYKDNKYYFGKDLKPFIQKDNLSLFARRYLSRHEKRDYNKSVHIKYKDNDFWCYLEPVKDILYTNNNKNCPILVKYANRIIKYPKLIDLKLAKFIEPKTIYFWLVEWLSTQITNKEKIQTIISNAEKIEAKGFDKKKSFRPKMK